MGSCSLQPLASQPQGSQLWDPSTPSPPLPTQALSATPAASDQQPWVSKSPVLSAQLLHRPLLSSLLPCGISSLPVPCPCAKATCRAEHYPVGATLPTSRGLRAVSGRAPQGPCQPALMKALARSILGSPPPLVPSRAPAPSGLPPSLSRPHLLFLRPEPLPAGALWTHSLPFLLMSSPSCPAPGSLSSPHPQHRSIYFYFIPSLSLGLHHLFESILPCPIFKSKSSLPHISLIIGFSTLVSYLSFSVIPHSSYFFASYSWSFLEAI